MQQKKYKCVFFDLDHTLWDYETNSRETLEELFLHYNLQNCGVASANELYHKFQEINFELWDLYDRGLIDSQFIRRERFKRVFGHFGFYDEDVIERVTVDYLALCPRKGKLMPHARDILEYLAPRYRLSIITNGFDEIQHVKLTSGDIIHFFDHVVTSQRSGYRKPSPGIFHYARSLHDVECGDAVMIGDNLTTDIGGANAVAIDSVFFNPLQVKHQSTATREIACLSDLKKFL